MVICDSLSSYRTEHHISSIPATQQTDDEITHPYLPLLCLSYAQTSPRFVEAENIQITKLPTFILLDRWHQFLLPHQKIMQARGRTFLINFTTCSTEANGSSLPSRHCWSSPWILSWFKQCDSSSPPRKSLIELKKYEPTHRHPNSA